MRSGVGVREKCAVRGLKSPSARRKMVCFSRAQRLKGFLKSPMPKATTEPSAKPIRISDNTVFNGKFYNRYEPLPVERVEDLPEILRPLVVSDVPEDEGEGQPDDGPRNIAFQLNTPYGVDKDGRLTRAHQRKVDREVAELEAKNAQQEWIEDELASAELPPEIAEDLQAKHDDAVAFAKAQAEVDARRADEVADAAIAAQEPVQMYVRRGDRHYAPAGSARLKPGEDVFVRQPSGRFHCIGTTDGHAELPDPPIEI